MKKVLLLLVGGLFITAATQAQSYERPIGSEFSIGVSPMLPVGDFGDVYSFGIGADLKYAYNFNESIAATVSAGYNHFIGKTFDVLGVEVKPDDAGFVPIKAGVRFSMGQFYAEPQIGAAIGTNKGSETNLVYAGQIGVMVNRSFDIGFRYEGISSGNKDVNGDAINLGYIGLRLAYTLSN